MLSRKEKGGERYPANTTKFVPVVFSVAHACFVRVREGGIRESSRLNGEAIWRFLGSGEPVLGMVVLFVASSVQIGREQEKYLFLPEAALFYFFRRDGPLKGN